MYKKQQGIVAVESVFILPFIILIMFIILDFGRVMFTSVTTANAARAAAGYGAQSTNLSIDYAGMTLAAVNDASNLKIDDDNTATVSVSARRICRCIGSSVEVDCVSNSCGASSEVYVEVTATRDFHTIVPYPYIPESVLISRTATMRVQ
ncbi:MAG: pilus assembly protein [Aliivibrio sp.]|uniref:TadE/TadG family type IV pilus assembly protein n=1 Tax=Aliivibrio sp. TaxID=1872443 RepID=UPI001A5C2AC4|nr:pilus assembly protein [Aliivibrio sp.]